MNDVVPPGLIDECEAHDPGDRPSSDAVLARCYEDGDASSWQPEPEWAVKPVEAEPGAETVEGWQIAPKFKLDSDLLDFEDQVAEGGFSEIYLGTYNGEQVAVKKLKVWL